MSPISDELREKVRKAAKDRCGYCLSAQIYVMGKLEIEHIIPTASGGTDEEDNLWLACRLCNNYKATQTHHIDPETGRSTKLFNPRVQTWTEHFQWDDTGTHIVGLSPCGRATVIALKLNNDIATQVRKHWVAAGWHPPKSD